MKCPRCGGEIIINNTTNLLECEKCGHIVLDGVSDEIRKNNAKVDSIIRERDSKVKYDSEMRQNELNYQKQQSSLFFHNITVGLLLILVVVLIGFIASVQFKERNNERLRASDGFVNVPGKSSSLIGKNYEDVVKQFETCGFTNIVLVETWETVSYNVSVQDGKVTMISIDGYSSFDQYADFKPDSLVKITYVNYKKKTPPIRVNASAESYRGENVSVVKAEFEALGFEVQLEEIKDLTTGLLIKDGTVERVSIGGNSTFEKGTTFDSDDVVIIAYHTFK